MRIGIDLDGVVFDTESYFRAYADLFNYQKNLDFTPPDNFANKNFFGARDPQEARGQKRYSWSEDLIEEFLDTYLIHIQSIAPLLPLAKHVLDILHEQGHELIVITRRGYTRKQEIDVTYERCEKEGLHFDEIIFGKDDKIQTCHDLKLDVMLEDYYDNVVDLANHGIPCIYFRGSILKFCDNPNVIDVENWGQALLAIDILDKQKKKES